MWMTKSNKTHFCDVGTLCVLLEHVAIRCWSRFCLTVIRTVYGYILNERKAHTAMITRRRRTPVAAEGFRSKSRGYSYFINSWVRSPSVLPPHSLSVRRRRRFIGIQRPRVPRPPLIREKPLSFRNLLSARMVYSSVFR